MLGAELPHCTQTHNVCRKLGPSGLLLPVAVHINKSFKIKLKISGYSSKTLWEVHSSLLLPVAAAYRKVMEEVRTGRLNPRCILLWVSSCRSCEALTMVSQGDPERWDWLLDPQKKNIASVSRQSNCIPLMDEVEAVQLKVDGCLALKQLPRHRSVVIRPPWCSVPWGWAWSRYCGLVYERLFLLNACRGSEGGLHWDKGGGSALDGWLQIPPGSPCASRAVGQSHGGMV